MLEESLECVQQNPSDDDHADQDVYVFQASFAQQRLWFFDQLEPGLPLYNIPLAVRLVGEVDRVALERSVNEIVRRHEALRTTFVAVEGEAVQVVTPFLVLQIPVIDLHLFPESVAEGEVKRIANEEALKPFNLRHGPLIRIQLVKLKPEDHVLLLTMHHIISDGWSINIFVSEFSLLYEAFSAGKGSPLPDLSIQYADFAHWQRDWLKGEVLESQLNYWKQKLSGNLPILELPADRLRPAVQSFRGAASKYRLSKKLLSEVKRLGQEEGTTLFMTLLAAYQTLLSRYSGQEDICVGSPIANRNQPEIKGLIGFFANTLVFRTDLSGNPTFRELLRRVRQTSLEAYEHQDLPFEMLVEALQPQRDQSLTPLFQTMFMVQNAPSGIHRLRNLTMRQLEVETRTSTFDVTLSISEQPDGLEASVEYNTDLFDAGTICRLLNHWENLLEEAVRNPDRAISELELTTPTESFQILEEWNDSAAPFPEAALCLHHLFEGQVKLSPNSTAVILPVSDGHPEKRLTYLGLNQRANQLAHFLRGLGVGPDAIVGVGLERSPELIVSLLGILKAGGAFLAMDPAYPWERLAFMMSDSGIKVLLTSESLLDVFPEFPGKTVCLDRDWERILQESGQNPPPLGDPDHIAYVIYTSGSTGKPKGVMIPHSSVVNHNLAVAAEFSLQESDRVLQFSSISFDAAIEEIFPTLIKGAAVVLRPEGLLSAEGMVELLLHERISVLDIPTVYWHQWVHETAQMGWEIPSCLRLVIVGGEEASGERLSDWFDLGGESVEWMNTYGPTETAIIASAYRPHLEKGAWQKERKPPIGRPIANLRLYILDKNLRMVPVGVAGDLYIAGAGLARGYLNRPALTAEKFIPNPFDHFPGGRLYKTGDRARYLPDGNMEYLGRADQQFKLRGFRIEPGEIEEALLAFPSVRESVALARENHQGGKRIVGYLVSKEGEVISLKELRGYLKSKLPEYMVPSAFVLMEELPLLTSGKVDRNALPSPVWDKEEGEVGYAPPGTVLEEILVGIWGRVLGCRIGIRDNFFDRGGHSLLAAQVISRVRSILHVDMPLRSLFEAPTVRAFAEKLEILRGESGETPPIQSVTREKDLPLSFSQQRLWILDQLEPNSPLYNLPVAVQVIGPLKIDVLKKCVKEIIRRHEILRSAFLKVDGTPSQSVLQEMEISIPVVQLNHLSESRRGSRIAELIQETTQQPFDLVNPPLLRFQLLRANDQDHVIVVVFHHIVADDWSTKVLVQEIAILYDAFSKGNPSPLPELPVQYADFACWQRGWLKGEVLEAQLGYWKEKLKGIPPLLELPTDRPRPPLKTYHGEYCTLSLPGSLSERIRSLTQQEGVTLFMVLLGAFQALLYRYTGQEEICVGTPVANRNRAETEGLIGFFVNTLVLRASFSDTIDFCDLLKQVRETALEAYTHQDLPFESIVDALEPQRDLSHSPLFQVMFSLQSSHMQETIPSLSDLTFRPVEAHSGTSKFDLTLFMSDEGECLKGAIEYNTDLFDRATVERMIRHFEVFLTALVDKPTHPISDLSLQTEEDHRRVSDWNDTDFDCPLDLCAHQMFEAQVLRTPDAVSVTFDSLSLSYLELNRRANQLAHHLRGRGVGPDTLVGLFVERSIEMVVGILGILKAGGAYVPLDPYYPPERLSFMLEDTRLRVLLTRGTLLDRLSDPALFIPCPVLLLDKDWEKIAHEPDHDPPNAASPDNLAYVIYTSGSTGRPKGTMISHRGLVNYLTWTTQAYPLKAGQGSPVHSSISFDLTITSIFTPLMAGRRILLVSEDSGAEGLGRTLQSERDFSLVKITPAHLQLLGEQLSPHEAAGRTRAFIIGGENLLSDHINFWQSHAPETALVNEYGPTETVVGCCVYWAQEESRSGVIPIGRPIINTKLYVLDSHLQPVPTGTHGELHIGGAGVARGYLNRPDLTAEKFIPDPFEPGSRMYKTGDLVRYRPDGNLECLGRVDHQVKIRGFRIELGEIEAVLSEHPDIKDSVVWAWKESGREFLVAYAVPQEKGSLPETSQLKDFLRQRLPEYMVPSVFLFLEGLPLTSNGKVDRKALPAPERMGVDGKALILPRDHKERVLANIWIRLLGLKDVGVQDNFFELGGDSIKAIQLVSRANQAGIRLTARQVFEYPTIASLASVADTTEMIEAEQGFVEGPVPLAPIQRWFLEKDFPEPHHWNQAMLLEMNIPLEREALKSSLQRLINHHDALRSGFKKGVHGWEQFYSPPNENTPLEWYDLSLIPKEVQAGQIEALSAKEQRSLDLEHGPLVRAACFYLGPDRPARFLLVFHHLVMDGVSWRIFLEDFQTAYSGFSEGKMPVLPLKTTSYRKWSQVLVDYAQTDEVKKHLEYWVTHLHYPFPEVPMDFASLENLESSACIMTVGLGLDETDLLVREIPARHGVTIMDVLVSALASAIGRWLNSSTVLIEVEGHGREHLSDEVDTSRTVGWFTTSYPVRLDMDDRDGPIGTVKKIANQIQTFSQVGKTFGLLRYLCKDNGIGDRLKNLPQPQISFNYLGQFDEVVDHAGVFQIAKEARGADRSDIGGRTHVIEINGGRIGGRLQFEWIYSKNLHRESTIRSVAECFIGVLRQIVECETSTDESVHYPPGDLVEFGWDEDDLEDISLEVENLVNSETFSEQRKKS